MNSRTSHSPSLPGSRAPVPPRALRLLDQVRERARYLHYSLAPLDALPPQAREPEVAYA